MKRSKHSLSNTKLFSCDMAELVPCGIIECLPGDSIQLATSMLVRASPLLAPVMHPVDVRLHHWFVPHRLVWDDFEDFITGGPAGTSNPTFPTITFAGGVAVGTLGDYLGVPLGVNNIQVSALPFRAYALIFNEWYRDQDLVTALTVSTAAGADSTTNTTLQNIAWEKDYFTSARPWEQKGPAITIPLGTTAPVTGPGGTTFANVVGIGVDQADNTPQSGTSNVKETGGATVSYGSGANTVWDVANDAFRVRANNIAGTNFPQIHAALAGWTANLTSASAITINLLREAMALQRFEEARARFGSRYVEYLRYLGVSSSDARLQRPEYLGGGRNTIQFSEVLQTAEGANPVGELRGHGIGGMRSNRFRRFFEEHGYILSCFSVRPKTIYMQGLARHWNRRTREDYWQRELEGIGQQEVLNKELYAAHTSPNGIFGYQDRYDEYRRTESSVAGEFRTSTLNHWHMAREFSSDPALNATFVRSVPTERTFAVPSEDVIYVYAKHSAQARRLVAATGKSYIY